VRAFELEWLGGAAERHFRKVRPGIDELPWGTLDPGAYPPVLVDRARLSWTEGAWREYCTAAAFAEVQHALLACAAPVDLVGMAGDFVADEMLHVELNARMAMELGGGAPLLADFDRLTPPIAPDLPAIARAAEAVVRTSCVGEALSVPLLAATRKAATHPLTHAVLDRIVRDESRHARLGWLFLEWAGDRLDAAERERLASVALAALRDESSTWRGLTSRVQDGVTSEGFLLAHVHDLGWMVSDAYVAEAERAVRLDVIAPLARFGIEIPPPDVDALFGEAA
jgi:hypothetical protein